MAQQTITHTECNCFVIVGNCNSQHWGCTVNQVAHAFDVGLVTAIKNFKFVTTRGA